MLISNKPILNELTIIKIFSTEKLKSLVAKYVKISDTPIENGVRFIIKDRSTNTTEIIEIIKKVSIFNKYKIKENKTESIKNCIKKNFI